MKISISHCSRIRNDLSGKASPNQIRTRYFRFNRKRRYQRQKKYIETVKRCLRLLKRTKINAIIEKFLAFAAAAAGGEEFELIIGQFEVLFIGELHDLIYVFAVSELLLLFIAQLGEDPFQ